MSQSNVVHKEVIRKSRNNNRNRMHADVHYDSDFVKIFWRNWVYKYEGVDKFTGLPIFVKTRKESK